VRARELAPTGLAHTTHTQREREGSALRLASIGGTRLSDAGARAGAGTRARPGLKWAGLG
jgi:hypothetical protein